MIHCANCSYKNVCIDIDLDSSFETYPQLKERILLALASESRLLSLSLAAMKDSSLLNQASLIQKEYGYRETIL